MEIIYEKNPRYYHRTQKQTQNPKDNDVNDNIIPILIPKTTNIKIKNNNDKRISLYITYIQKNNTYKKEKIISNMKYISNILSNRSYITWV